MNFFPVSRRFLALLTAATLSSTTKAGLSSSILQTAPVLNPNQWEATLHSDFLIHTEGTSQAGLNFSPRVRTGLIEHLIDGQIWLGAGITDFQMGAKAKYNVLPDIEKQIAVSILAGSVFLRDSAGTTTINNLLINTGVLASKAMGVDFGTIEPYGAVEVEWLLGTGSHLAINGNAGAKWHVEQFKPWSFASELQLNIRKSLWGLGLGAIYTF